MRVIIKVYFQTPTHQWEQCRLRESKKLKKMKFLIFDIKRKAQKSQKETIWQHGLAFIWSLNAWIYGNNGSNDFTRD